VKLSRRACMASSLTLPGLLHSDGVLAAAFPTRPLRLVVPFAPGGPADAVARMLAPRLEPDWGQPLVVENRAGAGGSVAWCLPMPGKTKAITAKMKRQIAKAADALGVAAPDFSEGGGKTCEAWVLMELARRGGGGGYGLCPRPYGRPDHGLSRARRAWIYPVCRQPWPQRAVPFPIGWTSWTSRTAQQPAPPRR